MKLASIPVAVKVGSAGVLGGGGIAGAGLLINDRIQKSKAESLENQKESKQDYRVTGLDETLVNDSGATFSAAWESNPPTNNEAVLKVSASSSTASTPLTSGKWTCVIKGIIKSNGTPAINLSTENFSQEQQEKLFSNQLLQNKKGFVTSCARNRTGEVPSLESNWTSEIRVDLEIGTSDDDTNKYVFPSSKVAEILGGTYINPK